MYCMSVQLVLHVQIVLHVCAVSCTQAVHLHSHCCCAPRALVTPPRVCLSLPLVVPGVPGNCCWLVPVAAYAAVVQALPLAPCKLICV